MLARISALPREPKEVDPRAVARAHPLAQLFEMRNPVKEQPLVDLTVGLTGGSPAARSSVEMNRQISAWASSRLQQLLDAGVRNLTWYAQSLSVLEFILEREGGAFVRQMAARLREGARMEELLAEQHPWVRRPRLLRGAVDPLGGDPPRAGGAGREEFFPEPEEAYPPSLENGGGLGINPGFSAS